MFLLSFFVGSKIEKGNISKWIIYFLRICLLRSYIRVYFQLVAFIRQYLIIYLALCLDMALGHMNRVDNSLNDQIHCTGRFLSLSRYVFLDGICWSDYITKPPSISCISFTRTYFHLSMYQRNKIKFKFLAQFSVHHILHVAGSKLILLLHKLLF